MRLFINESGEQKAKRLFKNPEYMDHIKTFAIFTAANPDKKQATRAQNKENNKELKKELSVGDKMKKGIEDAKYTYYKVKGKYDNVEPSFIVYNITLEDAKKLSGQFHQQSFIFGKNDDGQFTFEFWANASKSGYSYKKVDERDSFDILDNDAENYYTQISRDFKFSIPFETFNVAIEDMVESINTKARRSGYSKADIMRLIDESVDTDIYAKGRYFARASLFLKKDR